MQWPTFTDATPNEAYNFSSKPHDLRPVRLLIVMGLLFMAAFLWVYFQPQNRGYSWLFALLTISVLFKSLRLLHEWYHYWQVKPLVRPAVTRDWTVDVLTTYCPGEPHAMIINTLRAIQAITYPHTTYLCDEANDPYLRQVCAEMGVRHMTRRDKTDAKAGNINNALQQATGDICLVIDPDHVPVPDFLDHVLPYFEDSAVGFVQCAQAYYNRKESVVAFGATEQTYSFYGPMMTCMGQYGTAQAIGANCTFRREALDSIGGHANGLSEDMHTAMRLHAKGWTSAYVPLPLSYGLVPATLSAYYKQQLKWARGTFELLVTTYPRVFGGLSFRQKLHYGTLPLYYLLGTVQLIDILIPILSLVLMRLPLQLDLLLFATAYVPVFLTAFLVRQYAQRWLVERHEAGFHLVGGVLASGTWWVYVLGFVYTIFRVKVPYIPTPKDDKPRNNLVLILPNLLMALLTLGAIGFSLYWYGRFTLNNVYSQLMIGFGLLNVLIMSINIIIGQEKMLLTIGSWISRLSAWRPDFFWSMRLVAWRVRYSLYYWLRRWALPLFIGVLVLTLGMGVFTYNKRTDHLPRHLRFATTQPFYVGLTPDGTTLARQTADTLIVPYHLSWPVAAGSAIPGRASGQPDVKFPLLLIEPAGLSAGEGGLQAFLGSILRGERDEALAEFALSAKAYGTPILVSFMPRFDDPAQPWSLSEERDLALYQQTWRYLVAGCRRKGADNLLWVWCPTKPATLVAHYPGNDAVDWLGFDEIDDPAAEANWKSHSFAALFQPIHTTVRTHPDYTIRQKPILITQLSSLTEPRTAAQWTTEALDLMRERYPEIRGVVFGERAALQRHRKALMTAAE
ncbi:glycosyltransferase [Fibrella sp. HMF5335]|uniref:Glycosyltransferase n=1 Tax=Fibrella rubiginis TaxID=2817060 RepID=A0A939GFN2_9BACT|nr:glycosyltransferase [Fibrella rubiginis]MBO0938277.1 glycosyltransferase [Fibrella rubiginis]